MYTAKGSAHVNLNALDMYTAKGSAHVNLNALDFRIELKTRN